MINEENKIEQDETSEEGSDELEIRSDENTGENIDSEDASSDNVEADDTDTQDENTPVDDNDNTEKTGDEFASSLRSLSASGITDSFKGKQRSLIDGVFLVRMFILVICSSVFMYSVYSIYQKVADGIRTDKLLSGIVDTANVKSAVSRITTMKSAQTTLSLYDALGSSDSTGNTENRIDYEGEYDAIRFSILDLKSVNSDIYGWIRITGMTAETVEYPVVRGDNNDVYLYRNIYGEYTKSGSIFVDYRNSPVHSKNYNTIFYGHCMTNGTMFRPIMYWFEDPQRNKLADTVKIEIITLDAVYVYELFSSYRSEGSHFVTTSFADENAYLTFLNTIYSKSVIRRKVKYDANSRIITLSTCTNVASKPDERYVVHAILKEIIKYS